MPLGKHSTSWYLSPMAKTLSLQDWEPEPMVNWGITSPRNPVFLAFWLNNVLGLSLRRSSKDLVIEKDHTNFSFIQYHFVDTIHTFTWFLVENRSYETPTREATLFGSPEIPIIKRNFRIDYLLQVTGEGIDEIEIPWRDLISKGIVQAGTLLQLSKKEEQLLHFEQYETE